MIKIVNISKSYSLKEGELDVLKNINLNINTGELVAITGAPPVPENQPCLIFLGF